ncbi:hypothetical protein A2210_00120 [Candidatus Woesebacteria bacterium RIFOXYA1_FULL_40_18]|uniref:Uncharacterized protein n=1 Tax=Candidatus Woesebacteria bacterium RIFOXYA1_FULL_40_18 TaxID=1802532 RepID=A0A1F8CKR7_9BACT|nr:MAG: hypothetical protein A2210_00120 [Candidatus Woesebacteria bacterium RIFOXYA1_FULL_40_18]
MEENVGKITRKEFLQKAGVLAAGLAVPPNLRLIPEFDLPIREHQGYLPGGTKVRFVFPTDSENPSEKLLKMNGPSSDFGKFNNTSVLWVPAEKEKTKTDSLTSFFAQGFLKNNLIVRAVGEFNPKTESGWMHEDIETLQHMLNLASERNQRFFGQPIFMTGFLPVFHPNEEEAQMWKSSTIGERLAGLFGQTAVDGKLIHAIQVTVPHIVGGIKNTSEELKEHYLELLIHELGHGWLGGIELPPFDNHSIVRTVGWSRLMRMYEKGVRVAISIDSSLPGYHKALESFAWGLSVSRGHKEFFADLLEKLFKKHGTNSYKFNEEQVVPVAEEIFKEYRLSYTFKDLVSLFNSDESPSNLSYSDFVKAYKANSL